MHSLKILADENMLNVEHFFSPFGEITRFNGRKITTKLLKDVDVLLVRSITPVNQQLLESYCPRFIGSATIGTDHVDLDYLKSRDIKFANAPGCNAQSVAQYILASLSYCNQLSYAIENNEPVGIVGAGNVGSKIIQACDLLGIPVKVFDPFQQKRHSDYPYWSTYEEVLKCKIITFHVPLTKAGPYPTFHMLDDKYFDLISEGTLLINSSRGAVINTENLIEVASRKNIKLVLDVWEGEPNIHYQLCQQAQLSTSHIAGYSYEGKLKGTEMIYCSFLEQFNLSFQAIDLTDSSSLKRLKWDGNKRYSENIQNLILATYPIGEDSENLKSCNETELSQVFDLNRKNYWKRREFSNFEVVGVTDEDCVHCLKGLGFKVKLSKLNPFKLRIIDE